MVEMNYTSPFPDYPTTGIAVVNPPNHRRTVVNLVPTESGKFVAKSLHEWLLKNKLDSQWKESDPSKVFSSGPPTETKSVIASFFPNREDAKFDENKTLVDVPADILAIKTQKTSFELEKMKGTGSAVMKEEIQNSPKENIAPMVAMAAMQAMQQKSASSAPAPAPTISPTMAAAMELKKSETVKNPDIYSGVIDPAFRPNPPKQNPPNPPPETKPVEQKQEPDQPKQNPPPELLQDYYMLKEQLEDAEEDEAFDEALVIEEKKEELKNHLKKTYAWNPPLGRNSMFFRPTYAKYSKLITISTIPKVKDSISKLEAEWKSANTRHKQRRLIKVATLAGNRAEAMTRREKRPISAMKKKEKQKIAELYRDWTSKHSMSSNNPPEEMKDMVQETAKVVASAPAPVQAEQKIADVPAVPETQATAVPIVNPPADAEKPVEAKPEEKKEQVNPPENTPPVPAPEKKEETPKEEKKEEPKEEEKKEEPKKEEPPKEEKKEEPKKEEPKKEEKKGFCEHIYKFIGKGKKKNPSGETVDLFQCVKCKKTFMKEKTKNPSAEEKKE